MSTNPPVLPVPPESEALTLWRHIYGEAAGYLAAFTAARMGGPGSRLTNIREEFFAYPVRALDAWAYLRGMADKGYESYHGAHLLEAPRRLKEQAAPLYALYVDGDGAHVGEQVPQPTAIVESSPSRHQYYWRLSRPVEPRAGEELNRQLALLIGGDKSGYDLTQLLRPPGTVNHKYVPPVPVRLLSSTDHVHDADELAEFLRSHTSPIAPVLGHPTGAQATVMGRGAPSPRGRQDPGEMPPVPLSRIGRERWEGKEYVPTAQGGVDRSKSLVLIAQSLAEAGASHDVIWQALAERDQTLGWNKYSDRKDAVNQYRNIADSAISRASSRGTVTPNSVLHHTDEVCSPERMSDFSDRVTSLLTARAGRQEKGAIADMIGDWCLANQRLLREDDGASIDPATYLRDDNNAVLPLSGKSGRLTAALASTGLNPSEPAFKWLLEDLKARAVREGVPVKLSRYTLWKSSRLMVSSGPSDVVLAKTDGSLEKAKNGHHNVLFAADAVFPGWQPSEDGRDPLELSAMAPRFEPPRGIDRYTTAVQTLLLRAWLICLVGGIRPLPALMPFGAKDSGKSTLARGILRLLLGEAADVVDPSLRDRDFTTLMTTTPVLAIDNLDSTAPPYMQDVIASTVTGADIARRQLYTDGTAVHRVVTASLIVTTRTAAFANRADLAERLLPLFVVGLDSRQRRGDLSLMDEINANRDRCLSWLVSKASQARAHVRDVIQDLPGRFSDFAKVVYWLEPEIAHGALAALEDVLHTRINTGDPLLGMLLAHVPDAGLRGTGEVIIHQLRDLGAEYPPLPGKTANRRLRDISDRARRAGLLMLEEQSRNRTIWQISRTESRVSDRTERQSA